MDGFASKTTPEGPAIEKINPDRKFRSWLEISNFDRNFNLDQKLQSRCFYLRGPLGVQRSARSKISVHDRSLEIFNPEGRDQIFCNPSPKDPAILKILRSYKFTTVVAKKYDGIVKPYGKVSETPGIPGKFTGDLHRYWINTAMVN